MRAIFRIKHIYSLAILTTARLRGQESWHAVTQRSGKSQHELQKYSTNYCTNITRTTNWFSRKYCIYPFIFIMRRAGGRRPSRGSAYGNTLSLYRCCRVTTHRPPDGPLASAHASCIARFRLSSIFISLASTPTHPIHHTITSIINKLYSHPLTHLFTHSLLK